MYNTTELKFPAPPAAHLGKFIETCGVLVMSANVHSWVLTLIFMGWLIYIQLLGWGCFTAWSSMGFCARLFWVGAQIMCHHLSLPFYGAQNKSVSSTKHIQVHTGTQIHTYSPSSLHPFIQQCAVKSLTPAVVVSWFKGSVITNGKELACEC